jgi:L-amino acid N-acyltransferase YncA
VTVFRAPAVRRIFTRRAAAEPVRRDDAVTSGGLTTRAARPADASSIAEIYNAGIRDRIATFETRERSPADVLRWLDDPRHPVLVAERGGTVVGWIAASRYRDRECYAGVAEFSVYVHPGARRQGIGEILMRAFVPACEDAGLWKLVSRIFPENVASRGLCARTGFREVGVYRRHGRLDGVWRDVVIVERLIGEATEP